MTSQKQVEANRRNAAKSTGPKTASGKAVSARNALKHGLLAQEVVITTGEGAEDSEAFEALLAELIDHFQPADVMERMLVERIAAGIWRKKRAFRCENGMIRSQLDTLTDDYYAQSRHDTDAELDKKIADKRDQLELWKDAWIVFNEAIKEDDDLSAMDDWPEQWIAVYTIALRTYGPRFAILSMDSHLSVLLEVCRKNERPVHLEICKSLRSLSMSDRQIWQLHLETIPARIREIEAELATLEKTRPHHALRIEALRLTHAVPEAVDLSHLLRYETANDRRLDAAVKQLERLQKRRGVDPAVDAVTA